MKSSSWLTIPKANPNAKLRLFCFPYSGAPASMYYQWANLLPDSIEVCPVQYPGHGTRIAEPLMLDLPKLIHDAGNALNPYFDKPFAFFGHSMGALVSFELARWLRRNNGASPLYMFVSGHTAPQLPDTDEPIHTLPHDQFVERLRTLNGTPEDVLQNDELRDLVVPILRADFTICETYAYQPEPPFDFPICALGGLSDHYVTRQSLQSWQEQTTIPTSVRMFPGDHFYLNNSRMLLIQVIARELLPYL